MTIHELARSTDLIAEHNVLKYRWPEWKTKDLADDPNQKQNHPFELLYEIVERPLIAWYIYSARLGGKAEDDVSSKDVRVRRQRKRRDMMGNGKLMRLLKASTYLRGAEQDLSFWHATILDDGEMDGHAFVFLLSLLTNVFDVE